MTSTGPQAIDLQGSDTIESAAAKIGVQPKSLILLTGDFDAAFHPQIRSICSRAIAPLALSPGALIIDSGSGGPAAAFGEAARELDEPPVSLGIMGHDDPAGDPNHTFLLRLPAEWPDALKARFQVSGQLAKDKTGKDKPVVAVLFGGGGPEQAAVIQCARRQWPVLVIQGSGGLADLILAAGCPAGPPPSEGAAAAPITDPDLREIVETADISSFPIAGDIDDLKRLLLSSIELRTDTLADAWARYDDLDQNAVVKQRLFKNVQLAAVTLAVAATLLAIVQSLPDRALDPYRSLLHVAMVLAPIAISVLVTSNSRFREGNKWILLRAAAEAMKREIFRYRAQAGVYSDDQCAQTSRESMLAAKLKDISSGLSQSEVNKTSILHYAKDLPQRLTFLSPEEYLEERIADQINHFTKKTKSLYKRLKRFQLCIYLVGGAGTFLAAFHYDVWVALTTAMATAVTTKLETDQVENTVVQYNQALSNLQNISLWWKALSQWEKSRRRNIDLLVDQTEKTLEGELAGWVQHMQSALDKMTEKQAPPDQQGPSK